MIFRMNSIFAWFRTSNAFIVSGSQDTTAKVWSLENLILDDDINDKPQNLSSLFTLKTHDKEVNSVSVSYNDKQFATGSADKTAKVIYDLYERIFYLNDLDLGYKKSKIISCFVWSS